MLFYRLLEGVINWQSIIDVWVFPKDVHDPKIVDCEAVFSIILDSGHIVNIDGHEVVCLGHNFHEPKILEHDYFGSDKVVKDLQKMPGFSGGRVILKTGCIVDDGKGSVKFTYNGGIPNYPTF